MNRQLTAAPFTVPVTISNLTSNASVTLDVQADPSKIFPIIPASILRSIGVEPRIREIVELVNGTWLTIDEGDIHVTIDSLTARVPCVFGPEQEPPTLGHMVLEVLSLKVDEEQQRLVPVVRRWIEHG